MAVLEEEVVRLEEQIVSFRQGLYEEAVCISSRKSSENPTTPSKNELSSRSYKQTHSRSSSQSEINPGLFETRLSPSLSRIASSRKLERQPQNEQMVGANFDEDKITSLEKKSSVLVSPVKRPQPKIQVNIH